MIHDLLKPPYLQDQNLDRMAGNPDDIEAFNRAFGVAGQKSREWIQFPGQWSVRGSNESGFLYQQRDTWIADPLALRETLKFKWAFNIKPDLVIHLTNTRVIVIEAKDASGEGSYPTGADATELNRFFAEAGEAQFNIGQVAEQRYLFEELLGMDATFVLLTRRSKDVSKGNFDTSFTWRDAFTTLDTSGEPPFVQRWTKKYTEEG
jgi:hypothetical protein